MKLYMPGEKGRALCEQGGRVSTTFRYRDVPFSDGSGVARKILAGVCDHCGKVVSIPPQSTPSIRAARRGVNSLPTVTPFSRPIVAPLGRPEWAYPRSA